MNVVDRLGMRLAWGRVLKMFPALRRWLPLIAVIGLAFTTIARAAGKVQAADMIDYLLKLIGVVVSDPEQVAAVTASAGAIYKLVRLVIGLIPSGKVGVAPLLLLVLVPRVGAQDIRVQALAGGTVNLQADSAAQVTPLVQVEAGAALTSAMSPPQLIVALTLTGLPGESIDLGQPATYRALEASVGVALPLRSLLFRVYGEGGFATRLPGDPAALRKTARWAAIGVRFQNERALLALGIGPDQRLGSTLEVDPSAPDVQTRAPLRYQLAVTLRGSLALGAVGPANAQLVGSAILGVDLSRRWPSLDGGRTDVVRLGVAIGL